jgi:hypothetical protein
MKQLALLALLALVPGPRAAGSGAGQRWRDRSLRRWPRSRRTARAHRHRRAPGSPPRAARPRRRHPDPAPPPRPLRDRARTRLGPARSTSTAAITAAASCASACAAATGRRSNAASGCPRPAVRLRAARCSAARDSASQPATRGAGLAQPRHACPRYARLGRAHRSLSQSARCRRFVASPAQLSCADDRRRQRLQEPARHALCRQGHARTLLGPAPSPRLAGSLDRTGRERARARARHSRGADCRASRQARGDRPQQGRRLRA